MLNLNLAFNHHLQLQTCLNRLLNLSPCKHMLSSIGFKRPIKQAHTHWHIIKSNSEEIVLIHMKLTPKRKEVLVFLHTSNTNNIKATQATLHISLLIASIKR